MSDEQLKSSIGKELESRGINLNDPEVKKHYGDLVSDIQGRVRGISPVASSDDYFKSLLAGNTMPGVSNPQMKQATQRYNDFQKYQNMSPQSLSLSINSGKLIPGSQVRKDMEAAGMGASLSQAKTTANFIKQQELSNSILTGVLNTNKKLS